MADEDTKQDPLKRFTLPFAVALGFVWALAFALLVLDLRAGDWRNVDETAFVLLAFLLGISLLPFVSQIRIAGLFEFRRELSRLSEQVEDVKNQVTSLATASAVANQNTSAAQTQQVVLASGFLQELADRAGESQAKEAAEQLGDLGTDTPMSWAWEALWFELKLLLGLYYIQHQGQEQGLAVRHEMDMTADGIDLRFQEAVDLFTRDQSDPWKTLLSKVIEQANMAINSPEEFETTEDVLTGFMTLLAYLHGMISLTLSIHSAAYGSLLRDPSSGSEIIADTLRILESERKSSQKDRAYITARGAAALAWRPAPARAAVEALGGPNSLSPTTLRLLQSAGALGHRGSG